MGPIQSEIIGYLTRAHFNQFFTTLCFYNIIFYRVLFKNYFLCHTIKTKISKITMRVKIEILTNPTTWMNLENMLSEINVRTFHTIESCSDPSKFCCLKKSIKKKNNDPAIPLLNIYTKKSENRDRKYTCTPMFMDAIFISQNVETT